MRKHNKNLTPLAKGLRKNMTPQELNLWYNFLRDLPIRFLRQKVVGRYIVDFYCSKAKLVIEIDGGQHYEDKNIELDRIRTEYFESIGLTVLRFTNPDIDYEFDAVCEKIKLELTKRNDIQ